MTSVLNKKDSCLDKKNMNKKDLKKFSTCYDTCIEQKGLLS